MRQLKFLSGQALFFGAAFLMLTDEPPPDPLCCSRLDEEITMKWCWMRWCCAFCMTSMLFATSVWGEDLSKSHDWPQWRGPRRDGASAETGLLHRWPATGPKLLWNSKTVNGGKSVGMGYSSVAVADGRIFTMGDHGLEFVFALDEKTGRGIWATKIGAGWRDGGPRCTPTVDGDRLYALTPYGDLICLGVEKGEMRWHKNYADFGGRMMSGWGYSESPLIDGDKLVCTPGGDKAALVTLNKYSGDVLWMAPIPNTGGAGYSSIVTADVGGIRQYITILGQSGGVVGVHAANGELLWRYPRVTNGTANIPTPVVKDDLVFCSTGYNTGSALLRLVPVSGGIRADEVYFLKGNELQNHHGGVVRVGDYLYGGHGHNAGLPFCLNMKTGSFAWRPVRGPGSGSAAVVYADGSVYFRYQDNVMALIAAKPDGYQLLSQFNLPDDLGTGWSHPVVVHGKLFIRGADQILCFDVKK
jgi:outer membrane protein assembly factor BamB